MKKLLIACLILLFAFGAHALEWRSTNQATISWDPVTTLVNGDPIPATDLIRYRIYLKESGTTAELFVDEIGFSTYTITLSTEGKYIVGIQAVRYDSAGVEVGESEINWSDVNGEATPNPFGLVFFHPPS
ncbi:MAG: hypothetical protein ACYS6K_26290, partial [Planctomycetota bacterium]